MLFEYRMVLHTHAHIQKRERETRCERLASNEICYMYNISRIIHPGAAVVVVVVVVVIYVRVAKKDEQREERR